jgi:hypothetical protein
MDFILQEVQLDLTLIKYQMVGWSSQEHKGSLPPQSKAF